MRIASMGALLLLCTIVLKCSQSPKQVENKIQIMVPPVPSQGIDLEKVHEPITIAEKANTDTEQKVEEEKLRKYKEEMIDDIISVWEMFFDDDNAPITDPRREMFLPYANDVADAVIYYQNNEVDIGGRMPKHRSAHIIAAIWAARESSVRMNAVGTKNKEVCLFQLHGVALNGFSKEDIKNNSQLCAMLGVRWIAYSTSQCENNRKASSSRWNNFDWLRPMTMYGAGPKKTYKKPIKDRKCNIFSFARRRVNDISMYTSRIDVKRKQDLLSY